MLRRFSTRVLQNEIKLTEQAKQEMKFQAEREHHADKMGDTWKKISMFVCAPIIIFTAIQAYRKETAHLAHFHKSESDQEYLFVRRKPFPWGDGSKSFFHNDKYNHIK